MSPNVQTSEAIKGKVTEVYRIGDALAPRLAERAIFDGYKVARGL